MSKLKPEKIKDDGKLVDPDKLQTEDSDEDKETEEEDEEGTGGMMLEKEDIQLIHKALSQYKPTEDEETLYHTLLEMFEETLEVDYADVKFK